MLFYFFSMAWRLSQIGAFTKAKAKFQVFFLDQPTRANRTSSRNMGVIHTQFFYINKGKEALP